MGRTPYPLAPGETNDLYRVRMHRQERELFQELNARERGALIRRAFGLEEIPIIPTKTSTRKKRQKT